MVHVSSILTLSLKYKIMYKVKIKGFSNEVYDTDIKEILFIVSTFADTNDIISITKVTYVN